MLFSEEELREILREVILDNYEHPRNYGLVDDNSYMTVKLKNPTCGDDLTVQLKMSEDGLQITDIRQQGTGCSICCSSASVMSTLLKGKTKEEAKDIIANFKLMVSDEPFDETNLGEAIAYKSVAKLQPRIKCATLAWQAADRALDGLEGTHDVTED